MNDRNGEKWSRDETILAYDLYCKTTFGKISQSNPDIIELAKLLGRTPGSVGLKMTNLAHFDPELQKRNVKAMAHGSKLDAQIYEEFSKDWSELSYQAQMIRAKLQNVDIEKVINIDDIEKIPQGKYKEQVVKTRVGQYFFRVSVLSSYENRCCITGITDSKLLVASHIKPWSVSDEKTERTNPRNGLCLNALHDKAFDRGLITIDKNYQIIISKELANTEMDADTRNWLMSYQDKQIE